MLLSSLLLACFSDDTVFLEDAHNYAFSSTLTLDDVVVKEGQDVTFSWCDLTQDFLGLPLDPLDIRRVEISVWDVDEQTLVDSLVSTVIPQSALYGQAQVELSGVCETSVAAMSFLGTPVTPSAYILEDGHAYLVTLYDDQDARMTSLFSPIADTENDRVDFHDTSAVVAIDVDLDAGEPASPPGLVDWSLLTADGSGQAFPLNKYTRLEVYRFDEDLETLEEDFVRLELLQEEQQDWSVDGLLDLDLGDVDLFSDSGTWLMALRCGDCTNPAPPFLTVVESE